MPVMLELPAPGPQAEPTRIPFCLRPQFIRIFAAVCKFLLELVIMILYLPPGTPTTARNLGLAGARGCIYLAISGLGYSLVLTIQSQGNPDQATWITSTVNDALGVPSLSCQPLMRQKRGTLDFLFKVDKVATVSPTMPDSIIRTTLQPATRVPKAAPGKAIIGSNSSSSQPLDPRKEQETEVFQNTATQDQSLILTEGTETPSIPTATTGMAAEVTNPTRKGETHTASPVSISSWTTPTPTATTGMAAEVTNPTRKGEAHTASPVSISSWTTPTPTATTGMAAEATNPTGVAAPATSPNPTNEEDTNAAPAATSAIEILHATGIAILVLLILVLWGLTWLYGFRMGMKQERIKIRHQLKQAPANLNIEMANPPILKRITSVGKNKGTLADFALVDLPTVDLPASI